MVKLKKFPKKPKKTATIAQKEAYIKKVMDVKAQNAKIISDRKKSEALDKRIADLTK